MYYLPYNKNLKAFSRKLRNNSTLGEILLWKQLRAGKMRGFTFNRQKPLGNYIVDSPYQTFPNREGLADTQTVLSQDSSNLSSSSTGVVSERMASPAGGSRKGAGLSFLRFHDEEVRKDLEVVLRSIESYVDTLKEK